MKLNKLLHKKIPNKVFLILGLLIVFIALVGSYIFIHNNFLHNYAEETAKPLEAALVKAGAVKVCSRGDAGRGPSNQEPWYSAYFETSKDKSQAQSMIKEIASKNGYDLQVVGMDLKNYLGNEVYEDISKKFSRYTELQDGNVELSMALTNSGPFNGCPGKTVNSDASKTVVAIELSLPSFKP